VKGSGSRIWDSGFRVKVSGFRIQGSGSMVKSFLFRLWLRVQDSGFKV
jgi:hypothetical protein